MPKLSSVRCTKSTTNHCKPTQVFNYEGSSFNDKKIHTAIYVSAGVPTHTIPCWCSSCCTFRIQHRTGKVTVMVVGNRFLVVLYCCCFLVGYSVQFEYKHHNNVEVLKVLEEVHASCPNITRIYTLSETSVRGVPLYVIEFATTPGHHEICEWVV